MSAHSVKFRSNPEIARASPGAEEELGDLFRDLRLYRPARSRPPFLSVADAAIATTWSFGERSRRCSQHDIIGVGSAYEDDALALTCAVSETVERYCSAVLAGRNFVTAPYRRLAPHAMPTEAVPRCSRTEMADARCRVMPLDADDSIRWYPAVDLTTGREAWVPAALCFTADVGDPFQFWVPISTGCAAHPDWTTAVVNGIVEVCERDTIAIVWEQMLTLPRLDMAVASARAREVLEWYEIQRIQVHLFDATSDLGVPTAYMVDVAPYAGGLRYTVGCSSARTLTSALDRMLKEHAAFRGSLAERAEVERIPASPDEIASVSDGALYMGQPRFGQAFEFLLGKTDRHVEVPADVGETDDPSDVMEVLIGRLAQLGMNVYAADLTTDEARRLNLHVVRVIIPQLQPMSLDPFARFRAHPRLYTAPLSTGHRVRKEHELNPHPQPFA